ncbi:histone-lysine N-methyltransferase SETMAR [Trichonephila inaurata madagascariensis]|uniref:Histone-lysine N-methyltransferase SETMAR n=1 Tax=Trichonephila inaurata madagascariensis TaxID=2747483 RepID=A0A8X6IJG2_9ARAC|nr:histone-lysine N-methyltransferase SETMAR [Trichonephila inaurata madagascariensis]
MKEKYMRYYENCEEASFNAVHCKVIKTLYHFEKGWKVAQSLFGESTIGESRSRECSARFKSGDTSLESKSGRGRPSNFDDQVFVAAVEGDESLTTRTLTTISM